MAFRMIEAFPLKIPREPKSPFLVARAMYGAAKSPSRLLEVPYLEIMAQEPIRALNPSSEELSSSLEEKIGASFRVNPLTKKELLTLPWEKNKKDARVTPARTFASLIAFTDDQGKTIAREFFPKNHMHEFLEKVENKSQVMGGKPLTIPEQFDIALEMTRNNPLAAALLAHASYRAIARNADTKVDPSLSFSPDRMVSVAKATADFRQQNPSAHDPLGDTYHWWSQFSAQMVFTLLQNRHFVQTPIYTKLFRLGPDLTRISRRDKPASAGYHKEVDHSGWDSGRYIGGFLEEQLRRQRYLRREKRVTWQPI